MTTIYEGSSIPDYASNLSLLFETLLRVGWSTNGQQKKGRCPVLEDIEGHLIRR